MSRLPVGTYDPTEQDIVFNGTIIDGYASGTFIKGSRNEDAYSFQPSNSGGGSRSRNPNKSGRIEFTLAYGSPSNAALSAFAAADELSGEGVGEILVRDRSTLAAKMSAQNAWIVKVPDYERGKESGELTWVLETDELVISHDGLIPNT